LKKFIYNYITTNLINGKQYVGTHSTDSIDDGYLGSGKYLKDSVKKYGKENFKREIICLYETEKQAFDNEEKYIIEYNTLVPNGYNISPKGGINGKGSLSEETKKLISDLRMGKTPWNKGKTNIYSEESLKKMRNTKIGRITSNKTKEKLSNLFKGRILNEEWKEKISIAHKGKIHSKEHIENFIKANTGRKLSKEIRKNMSIRVMGENNPMYNKKHSTLTIMKIKEKAKNRQKIQCPYCNKIGDSSNIKRWHFDNCKFKNNEIASY
jgi:hypothetical protein